MDFLRYLSGTTLQIDKGKNFRYWLWNRTNDGFKPTFDPQMEILGLEGGTVVKNLEKKKFKSY